MKGGKGENTTGKRRRKIKQVAKNTPHINYRRGDTLVLGTVKLLRDRPQGARTW
jgi:hypothetical protein